MTLDQKIILIDNMILEDPEYIIRDYLNLLKDIESIEQQTENMGSRKDIPNLTEDQKQKIANLAADNVPVPLISGILGIASNTVYKACRGEHGNIKDLRHPGSSIAPELAEINSTQISRPPAEYGNRGYLSVTKKYAS